MPTKQQLESALFNADKGGDFEAAKKLANALKTGDFVEARQATEADRITQATGADPALFAGDAKPSADELGLDTGGIGETLGNVQDVGSAVLSSAAAPVIAGLGGIREFNQSEEGEGFKIGEDVRNFQDMMMFQPETPEGKKILQEFGQNMTSLPLMKQLVQGIQWIEETSKEGAEAAEELGAPPAISALIESAPQILPELLAVAKTPKAVKRIIDPILQADISKPVTDIAKKSAEKAVESNAAKYFTTQSPLKQEIARKLMEGKPDATTAGFQIKKPKDIEGEFEVIDEAPAVYSEGVQQRQLGAPKKAGDFIDDVVVEPVVTGVEGAAIALEKGMPKIEKNPIELEAIKQGYDKGVVASLSGANKSTRAKARQMVDIKSRALIDAEFRQLNRPSDVVGNSVMERYNLGAEIKKKAGTELDIASKGLSGQKGDATKAHQTLMEGLDELNIGIDADGKPVFTNSAIPENEALISSVLDEFNKVTGKLKKPLMGFEKSQAPDALRLHQLKKHIDRRVDFTKRAEAGIDGYVKGLLKRVRHDIDADLDGKFAPYDKANTMFSDAVEPMNALEDLITNKLSMKDKNIGRAVGILSNRLNSRAASSTLVMNAFNDLEKMAAKYNGGFEDNLIIQSMMSNEIGRVLGETAENSLPAMMQDVALKAGEAIERPATLIGSAFKAGVEKTRGINEQNRLKSLYDLINASD
jgi:hypothetical protein